MLKAFTIILWLILISVVGFKYIQGHSNELYGNFRTLTSYQDSLGSGTTTVLDLVIQRTCIGCSGSTVNVTWSNATGTNTTSTNLFSTNLWGTNVSSTNLIWYSATGTNTTSTNLYGHNTNADLATVTQVVATGTGTAIFSNGDIKMYDSNNINSTTTYTFNIDDEGFMSLKKTGSLPGFFEPYTILTVDSPDVTNPVEATITDRITTSTAFHLWDTYNEFYPTETQVGWRLVSRGTGGTSTGAFARDIVLDRQIGTAASTKEPLFIVTSSSDPYFGFGIRYPTAKFHFSNGNMLLKSTGTVFSQIDRGTTANYDGWQLFTNGVTKWSVGARNDATEDFHFYNETTATSTMRMGYTDDVVRFSTSTWWHNATSGPIIIDSTGVCVRIKSAAGILSTVTTTCPTY